MGEWLAVGMICRTCGEEKVDELFPLRYWGPNKKPFRNAECNDCSSLRVIRLKAEKMPLEELEKKVSRELIILKMRVDVLNARRSKEETK